MLYTLEELYNKKEDQTFDRKSARKDPKGLSNHVVAFANADGGTLVIGIEDDSTVTGIDDYQNNINDILRVPFDYCKPSIRITTETIDCVDKDGKPNHLLVISIPQSSELHANQQDDVYYRMGDKSKKLNFDERLQLMYAKGSRYYEDESVFRSSIEDIDLAFVSEYCQKIGYRKSAEEYIRQNNDSVIERLRYNSKLRISAKRGPLSVPPFDAFFRTYQIVRFFLRHALQIQRWTMLTRHTSHP